MTLTLSRVATAAWALWRRDRDLLVRIGLPFVLIPSLALQLLVPHAVVPASASTMEALRLQWRFAGDHAGAYLLASAIAEYGRAALLACYVDPRVGDVRGALLRAVRLWPRVVLLALIVETATFAGLALLVVPGMIVAGRLLPAAAVLLGERPTSAWGAVRRAFAMTRGQTALTAALAAMLLAGRLLVLQPFAAMDDWLRALNVPNPVALAVIDGAAAGANMLATIAGVLVAVVLYRRLSGGPAGAGEGTGASSGI